MAALRDQTETAARSEAKVLITGESGSGKEVVAHLLHQASRRGRRRMAVLKEHHWPGNVRELKNLAERLVVRTSGEAVRSRDIDAWLAGQGETLLLRPASGL